MNISLPPELVKLVHAKVESGRYASASEVIREALRAMDAPAAEARRRDQAAAADPYEGIRQGLEDLAAGRTQPARAVLADFRRAHGLPR